VILIAVEIFNKQLSIKTIKRFVLMWYVYKMCF